MKKAKPDKIPFLFGQPREGESKEVFTKRILQHLRQSGLFNEDGTNNLGKVGKGGRIEGCESIWLVA